MYLTHELFSYLRRIFFYIFFGKQLKQSIERVQAVFSPIYKEKATKKRSKIPNQLQLRKTTKKDKTKTIKVAVGV